jgi:hypothetical protein
MNCETEVYTLHLKKGDEIRILLSEKSGRLTGGHRVKCINVKIDDSGKIQLQPVIFVKGREGLDCERIDREVVRFLKRIIKKRTTNDKN